MLFSIIMYNGFYFWFGINFISIEGNVVVMDSFVRLRC